MKQFMVRVVRDTDDDYADVVVDAETEYLAQVLALRIVNRDPTRWFDTPDPPKYSIDRSSEVEDVTGGEYASVEFEYP